MFFCRNVNFLFSPRAFHPILWGILLLVGTLILLAPVSLADDPDPGFAIQFDGENDYVRLDRTDFIMTTGWTTTKSVEVWVKPTGTGSCTADQPSQCSVANVDAIFGDRARWWGISQGTINGENKIWVWNWGSDGERSIGIDYTVGEWMHIALVHGDGILRAYKNGVEIGSGPSGPTIIPVGPGGVPNHPVLYFGGIINNDDRKWVFEGEIDEVRIWNSARTTTEIVENMNRPLTGNEPDLAAYYQMTNGSGITVTDNSGHGWTGSLEDYVSGAPPQWVTSGAFSVPEPNLPPTADSQSVSTTEDTPVSITLTGTDPNSDTITFTLVSQPEHGVLSGSPPNLTYSPDANFNGGDSFSYVANDGQATSDPATATITITPVNDPPVAVDDSAVAVMDLSVAIPVLNNDSDVDGDGLTVVAVGGAQHGTAATDGTIVTYTPTAAFTGTDSFTYTIDDGASGTLHLTDTALVTVTVLASNSPPVAVDDAVATLVDTSVEISVLDNDSDPEGGTLTISQVGSAAHGTTTNHNTSITYVPDGGFAGTDVFTYQIFDGINGYDSATVTVTVSPPNTPPTAVDDYAYTERDTPTGISVLNNDFDSDGDPLTITAVGTPTHGTITHTGSVITYTPASGFSGRDVFSYTIADNRQGSDTAVVTITVGAGDALRFDGVSDFVQLDTIDNMMASTWATTKTLELWVKPTGTASCTVATHLCSANTVDNIFGDRPRSWGISRGTIGGEDKIWVWNFDGAVKQIGIDYTVDEWVYIALVHRNGMLYAYKNGVEVGSIASGATTGGATLYFGGSIKDVNSNWTFSGEIDEVRLWNTARTQAELIANIDHPLAGNESGLAAYYQMSDGSGATVTDDSGHGWTGLLEDGGSGVPADGIIQWVPSGAFDITITEFSVFLPLIVAGN